MKANVRTIPSTQIVNIALDANGYVDFVTDSTDNKFKARVYVDATGVVGIMSRKFGLQDKDLKIASGLEYNVEYFGLQNQTHLFIGNLYQGGYGWIFPFGGKRAIVGFGSLDQKIHSEVKDRLNRMLETKAVKKLVRKDNNELSGGTIPITNVKTKFVYKNVVCIGDSVSQVNPIVGEGHRFILEAAAIAAPYIKQVLTKNNMELLYGYENDWSRKFYNEYAYSKRLQVWADKTSKSNLLSDLFTLYLATKRNQTFCHLLAGNISLVDIVLP